MNNKTHTQYSFDAVKYAAKWFKANGYNIKITSDDLIITVNEHKFEISHSEIRNRAIDWLESELEGVKSY